MTAGHHTDPLVSGEILRAYTGPGKARPSRGERIVIPNISFMHPYVVHIVVGFVIAGCVLRIISLTGKWNWMNQAASTALILGGIASFVAWRSGVDAHGPAERVPGARAAVIEHEEWGERSRNLFLLIAAVEVVGLALPSRRRWFTVASAALGVVGLPVIYETAEHGGDLVYTYAGGVGLRTGEPEDVGNLLRAGLYHQAMLDRREHRGDAAGRLFAEMKQRWPADEEVQVLAADSRLRDLNDPTSALADIDAVLGSIQDPRIKRNATLIRAYAFLGLGQKDSARAVVERLAAENPANTRYRALADSLK
jgi:uncharacterized membrane protein